jgi:GntR family transcriptional regulator
MDQGGQNGNSRPRYQEIRDDLLRRILAGEWGPGQAIPTESEIAQHYGVGNGTARQAVGELERANVVVRIQGKGTFVFEHTPRNVLERFFHFYDGADRRIAPECGAATIQVDEANERERKALRLRRNARVIRIRRVRTLRNRPSVVEAISVPEARFPGLAETNPMPNTLYDLFQQTHGVHVDWADDRISPAAADGPTARLLGVRAGTPLLRIESVAFALDQRPVELRVSLCYLDDAFYYRAERR